MTRLVRIEMALHISKQAQWGHLWLAEAERFEYNDGDLITVASADLADELWRHSLMADDDPNFWDDLCEWNDHVYQREIMLPLEQSCHEGVLLPMAKRARRLQSCPEILLARLRWFFELCPAHVKSHLALRFYVLVRIDRARRTGSPEWCPATAKPATEESTFFRPPLLKFRNYAR